MTSQGTCQKLTDSRAKKILLANLRHELLTPVNAIVGYSEMLLEDLADQGQTNFTPDLQKINLCGTQLLSLIHTILDPNKLESSSANLDIASFGRTIRLELRTPLNAAIGYCELLLEEATADLVPDLNKIHAAAKHLLTMIDDIITLSQQQLNDTNIASGEALNLPFKNVATSALAQEVITTLRFLDKANSGGQAFPTGTILVVDDNETNRDLLKRQLTKQGHGVVMAASGEEALQKISTELCDLILLDIVMPGMKGYQVLEHLKRDDSCRHIPVIVISALDDLDSIVICLERGAEDYLTKPFNPVQLKARIDSCMEKKHLRDQEMLESDQLSQLNRQLKVQIGERLQSEAKEREKSRQLAEALKRLQQAQSQLIQSEKMASLGQLVAGVAYEIDDPINFIQGNLPHAARYIINLLKLVHLYQNASSALSPEIQQQIETIDLDFIESDLPKLLFSMQAGADRICGIVRSLRTFSQLDRSEKKTVDLHECIDSTLMILGNRMKARSGRTAIRTLKYYGVLPKVECYAGQMNQVFMNILINAIDSLADYSLQKKQSETPTNSGTSTKETAQFQRIPTITIRTEVCDTNWVRIKITDNGPGMSQALQQRLFDPFLTMKPLRRGKGMGMSSSYQIVTEKHKGRLQCNSYPGKGTEFVIEIPIKSN